MLGKCTKNQHKNCTKAKKETATENRLEPFKPLKSYKDFTLTVTTLLKA